MSSQTAAALNATAWAANSQNTIRQAWAWANSPPTRGPTTVAIPQILVTAAKTRARCRSGNISAMATIEKPEIQPPPTPCNRRPARKMAMFGPAALITQPAA